MRDASSPVVSQWLASVEVYGLRINDIHRPRAARLLTDSSVAGLTGTVRFEWAALDAWFEEDERETRRSTSSSTASR